MKKRSREEFLWDVFVTALETGIGYWSIADEYRQYDANGNEDHTGFRATIRQINQREDGYEDKQMRITPRVMERGVRMFSKYALGRIDDNGNKVPRDEQIPPDSYWIEFVKADRSNGAEGDYDAIVADMVVQFALLGKIVYG